MFLSWLKSTCFNVTPRFRVCVGPRVLFFALTVNILFRKCRLRTSCALRAPAPLCPELAQTLHPFPVCREQQQKRVYTGAKCSGWRTTQHSALDGWKTPTPFTFLPSLWVFVFHLSLGIAYKVRSLFRPFFGGFCASGSPTTKCSQALWPVFVEFYRKPVIPCVCILLTAGFELSSQSGPPDGYDQKYWWSVPLHENVLIPVPHHKMMPVAFLVCLTFFFSPLPQYNLWCFPLWIRPRCVGIRFLVAFVGVIATCLSLPLVPSQHKVGKDKVFVMPTQTAMSWIQGICVWTVVLFIRTWNFMGRLFVLYGRYSQEHSRKKRKWDGILQSVRELRRKESLYKECTQERNTGK